MNSSWANRESLENLYKKHKICDYGIGFLQFISDLGDIKIDELKQKGITSIEGRVLELLKVYATKKNTQ